MKLFAPTYGNTLRLNDKTTSFETVWRAFVIGMPTKKNVHYPFNPKIQACQRKN